MAISPYFDSKKNKKFFKICVVRKSLADSNLVVRKRAFGFETMADALKAEKRLNLLAEREMVENESKCCLWETLLEEWEASANKGDIFSRQLNSQTIRDYAFVVRSYTSDWLKLRVDEIDKSKAWLVLEKVECDISVSRRKRVRTAIDAIFSWGYLSGKIKGSHSIPTEGYKSHRKDEDKIPEILTLSEIRTLLSYAKTLDHPWYPIWALALMTGMRSGELYALEWSSVDFESRAIYCHRNWTNRTGFGPTKGRYWRTIPMSDELVTFMKEQKLAQGNEASVLHRYNLWSKGQQAQILREFCVGSGITSVKFHTLRACFATQLIKDGIAPAVVMKIAGWKDLKTMQRYIRLAGIEVKGATNGLRLLPEAAVMGRVVNLFGDPNKENK
jgi:integrase